MDGIAWVAFGSFITTVIGGIVLGIIKLWNTKTDADRTVKKDTVEYFERMFERLDRELAECKEKADKKDDEIYQLQRECAEERRLASVAIERREARIRQLEELLTHHNITFRPWNPDGTDQYTAIGKTTIGEQEKK